MNIMYDWEIVLIKMKFARNSIRTKEIVKNREISIEAK